MSQDLSCLQYKEGWALRVILKALLWAQGHMSFTMSRDFGAPSQVTFHSAASTSLLTLLEWGKRKPRPELSLVSFLMCNM